MSLCVLFITCLLFMFTVYCPLSPSGRAGLRAAASRLLWLCAGWRLFVRLSGPVESDRCEAAGSGWGVSETRGPGHRAGTQGAASEVTRRGDTPTVSGIMTWLRRGPGHHQIFRSMRERRAGIKLYLARGQYYKDRISIKAHWSLLNIFHVRFHIHW